MPQSAVNDQHQADHICAFCQIAALCNMMCMVSQFCLNNQSGHAHGVVQGISFLRNIKQRHNLEGTNYTNIKARTTTMHLWQELPLPEKESQVRRGQVKEANK